MFCNVIFRISLSDFIDYCGFTDKTPTLAEYRKRIFRINFEC